MSQTVRSMVTQIGSYTSISKYTCSQNSEGISDNHTASQLSRQTMKLETAAAFATHPANHSPNKQTLSKISL
jgi:hypothetical protein